MRFLGLFLVGAASVAFLNVPKASAVDPAELSQSRIDEIIKTFAENEKAFARPAAFTPTTRRRASRS